MLPLVRRPLLRRFCAGHKPTADLAEHLSKEVGPIKNLGSESVFMNPMDRYTRGIRA